MWGSTYNYLMFGIFFVIVISKIEFLISLLLPHMRVEKQDIKIRPLCQIITLLLINCDDLGCYQNMFLVSLTKVRVKLNFDFYFTLYKIELYTHNIIVPFILHMSNRFEKQEIEIGP